MNPIEELKAAKPAHLDAPTDDTTRSRELSYAMAQSRQVRARRRIAKPAWGLSLVGAAAAATTVALTVANGGVSTTPPSATSQTPAAPTVSLDARNVLLAAAHSAETQPDTVGKYWHVGTVFRSLYKAGTYSVIDQQKSETWTPFDPKGQTWNRSQSLGFLPATPADAVAWKAAGSPTKINVTVEEKGQYGKIPLSATAGPARTTHQGPVMPSSPSPSSPNSAPTPVNAAASSSADDKIFWLGKNVSMTDLRGLPSDQAALKKWLLNAYEGHGTESTGDKVSADRWLYDVSVGLIKDMPVTPKVRGAAFRMLANLKSIKVIQNVKVADGRVGTAVAINGISKVQSSDTGSATGVNRDELIYDTRTGQALAQQSIVVKPGGPQKNYAPGANWYSLLVTGTGWTDVTP
ncbi:MAG: CU044_5270 family protein [Streptosporangiaceae bacterium]